jgi:glutamate racemase
MSHPTVQPAQSPSRPVLGLFDSGLGGLSVLRAARAHLPQADMLYVADSGFAPYGERDEAFIVQRSQIISRFLLSQGAQALVVACNTATAAAVRQLRSEHPGLHIVGVEPGVKPAVAQSRHARVGVMATPGTLQSEKFRALVSEHAQGAHLVLQPCPGLAREIERGDLDTPALRELVARFCEPLKAQQVDTVVLGCTHYPFVAPLIQEALGPAVTLLDTADAVARQAARLLAPPTDATHQAPEKGLIPGALKLWSSGNAAHLAEVTHRWLGLHAPSLEMPAA